MKLIIRSHYLNTLIDVINTPDIKVLTGIRRAGKSKLLESFKDYLELNIKDANIIHINFNLDEYEHLLEYHALLEYVKNAYQPKSNNFILIDEVQMCSGFEKAINSLHASEKFNIYITGSNAFLLSSDLSTLFTGRTFSIEVFPFSFKEFCDYFNYKSVDDAFDLYVFEGGMAGSYLYKSIEKKYSYIAEVYNTLIIRDIKQRHKIRAVNMLNRVSDFLLDNISNISSPNKIANALNKYGDASDQKTVRKYIQYLTDAFAFYPFRRFDVRGKKYLASGEKYYLADHSFKYAILGTRNMDWGRTYENIVAIELLRRGYKVYAGFLYKKEIDFVAIKQSEKIYIQVCDDISREDTLSREADPLLKISDAYPKLILARTKHDKYQYEGIDILDIARWLMS